MPSEPLARQGLLKPRDPRYCVLRPDSQLPDGFRFMIGHGNPRDYQSFVKSKATNQHYVFGADGATHWFGPSQQTKIVKAIEDAVDKRNGCVGYTEGDRVVIMHPLLAGITGTVQDVTSLDGSVIRLDKPLVGYARGKNYHADRVRLHGRMVMLGNELLVNPYSTDILYVRYRWVAKDTRNPKHRRAFCLQRKR